jgi:hypothetical protein
MYKAPSFLGVLYLNLTHWIVIPKGASLSGIQEETE